ncbi:hypothetical protein [Psychromonas sp. CNPT3]|uniref:hypothetical protein n=1 Tax=Psychromonas sp. CNPT3 TaxID=314282 RepID=UPI00006E78D6|nr:hypothetical protein [Psychromonas sp. CNPT3]
MLTRYWTIDVFIIANLLLCTFVFVVYLYYQIVGGGEMSEQANNDKKRKGS